MVVKSTLPTFKQDNTSEIQHSYGVMFMFERNIDVKVVFSLGE